MNDFINFSLTETDMTAFRLLVLVLMAISWVLGAKTITQKGKIFDFIEDFFYTEVDRKQYKNKEGNEKMDLFIMAQVLPSTILMSTGDQDAKALYASRIEEFMRQHKEYSDSSAVEILQNIIDNRPNTYWHYKKVRKYPDKLVDPIIGCATCMPSLHTALVYGFVCHFKHWHFNPFVWGFVAIAATYWTERFWRKRNIEEKTFKKL